MFESALSLSECTFKIISGVSGMCKVNDKYDIFSLSKRNAGNFRAAQLKLKTNTRQHFLIANAYVN